MCPRANADRSAPGGTGRGGGSRYRGGGAAANSSAKLGRDSRGGRGRPPLRRALPPRPRAAAGPGPGQSLGRLQGPCGAAAGSQWGAAGFAR